MSAMGHKRKSSPRAHDVCFPPECVAKLPAKLRTTVVEGPVQEWNVHAFPNGRVPGIAEPYLTRLGSRRHYPQRKMAVG
jgi:hypothetical protein